jgi:hypothetical protein
MAMVIDIPKHPEHGALYDVIDLDTGKPLDVFYADDEAGVYRVYLKSPRGHYYIGPGLEVAWEEKRGRIKVIKAKESPRVRGQAIYQG